MKNVDTADWKNRQLTAVEVARILSVSVPTVYRWSRNGQMPKPRKFGGNTTRWSGEDLDKWQDAA
jgi:excisionase family DNA binding protein